MLSHSLLGVGLDLWQSMDWFCLVLDCVITWREREVLGLGSISHGPFRGPISWLLFPNGKLSNLIRISSAFSRGEHIPVNTVEKTEGSLTSSSSDCLLFRHFKVPSQITCLFTVAAATDFSQYWLISWYSINCLVYEMSKMLTVNHSFPEPKVACLNVQN